MRALASIYAESVRNGERILEAIPAIFRKTYPELFEGL